MVRPRDWLDRFRSLAAPSGPALSAAPPQESPPSELQAIFAALQPVVRGAQAIRNTAGRAAAAIRADAGREADELLAQARRRIGETREAALEQALDDGRRDGARSTAGAGAVADIVQRGRERLPAVADAVVADVCQEMEALTGIRAAPAHAGVPS